MNRYINITFILFFLLMLAVSCKTKKVSLIDSDGVLKSKTHNEIIDGVLEKELNYRTITTKGSVTLKGKKVTAIFKMVRDEIMQVSVRPVLGVEVMRIDITPEAIVLVDRLEGRYAKVNLQDTDISGKIAFDFYNLQALLTNQLFLAGQKNVYKHDYNKFDIGTEDNKYMLRVEDQNSINYSFAVNASDRITSTLMKSSMQDVALLFNYDQFVEDGGFVYPTYMTADVAFKKKKMSLIISYSHLDVNTDFNIDTSVSSKYKEVDVLDLIGAYMKVK